MGIWDLPSPTPKIRTSSGAKIPLWQAQGAAGRRARSYQSAAESNIGSMVDMASGASGDVDSAYDLFDTTGTFQSYLSAINEIDPQNLRRTYAADTQQSYDNAWGQYERGLSRMGVDPTSGKYASVRADWDRALAAALAGAKNKATGDSLTQKASMMGNAAQLSGSLASSLAGNKVGARQLGVGALQTAADFNSSQASGAAQLAGWASVV